MTTTCESDTDTGSPRPQPERQTHLPVATVADNGDWRIYGHCCDEDPDYRFPVDGRGAAAKKAWAIIERTALAACLGCPVRRTCLTVALGNGELHSIVGNATPNEMQILVRVWPLLHEVSQRTLVVYWINLPQDNPEQGRTERRDCLTALEARHPKPAKKPRGKKAAAATVPAPREAP